MVVEIKHTKRVLS